MNAPAELQGMMIPPHHIEAEQAVLGGLLIDNRAWESVAGIVVEADFYRDDHRKIFQHLARLLDQGKSADVLTVAESIERSNQAEQTGGLAYLGEIANATPSAANAHRYAEIVADRAMRRALLAVAWDIQNEALKAGDDPALARIDTSLGKVMALSESRVTGGEPEQIAPSLGVAIDEIEKAYNGDRLPGLSTGFDDLDHKTTGLQPGQMIVVAGRPSMGKTALAMNIAEHVATHDDGVALVFSMEMSKTELAKRSLASVGRIDANKLRTGKLEDSDWDLMSSALQRLHECGLIVDDTGGLTVGQMRARARRVKRKQGRLDLIVIDYLQLAEANGSGENRQAEITAISRGVKAMAKELRCPVIALSQLSRKVEERTNKRPLMSDLRESGAIEQDADIILMLYREEYYKPDTADKGIAEVIIGKQRNGPTGEVRLSFRGEFCRFDNLSRDFMSVSKESARPKRGKGFDGD